MSKQLYQETFAQVRSTQTISFDERKPKTVRRHFPRKLLLVAAVVSLVTAVATATVVARWFSLQELALTDERTVQQPDGTEVTAQVVTGTISLQGFGQMPEKLAVEEWNRFLGSYDYDSVLEELGNAPTGFEEQYGYYQVYTQEMADKLEEIVAKYGLRLHTDMIDDLYTDKALCDQVGGNFLGDNRAYSTYLYEDGTFKFDGSLSLPEYGKLEYQFLRCVYGSFTDIVLNIGDVADYTQWNYTTKSGTPVTLALSPNKALVLVDLADSFVTINVLAGTETPPSDVFSNGPLSASALEQFADSFNFSILTPVRPANPDLPRPALDEVLGTPSAEDFLQTTGISEADAQQFFATFFAYLENGDREAVAQLLSYPAVVTVQGETNYVHTPEELLVFYDDIFTVDLWESIITNQYTKERADLTIEPNGVLGVGGAIRFALQENQILIVSIENALGNRFCQGIA